MKKHNKMTKTLVSFGLVTSVLFSGGIPTVLTNSVAYAEQTQIGTVEVTTDSIYIRSNADFNSSIVGALKKGDKRPVYEQKNGMYNIGNGKWVTASQTYVKYQNGSTSSQNTGYIDVLADSLYVRSAPNFSASAVGVLHKGERQPVYGQQNGMYNIGTGKWTSASPTYVKFTSGNVTNPGNTTGKVEVLVDSLYVRSTPSFSGSVVGVAHKGQQYDIYGEQNGLYKIGEGKWISAGSTYTKKVNGNTGGGTTTPPVTPPTQSIGTAKVKAYSLYVRSAADFNASIVGTLHEGDTRTVYEEKNGLYRIGENQWISASPTYVTVTNGNGSGNTGGGETTPPPANVTGKVTIKADSLYVRSAADFNSSTVGVVYKGNVRDVYEQKNGLYRIGLNQWISANEKFVTFSNGSAGGNNGGGETKPPVVEPPVTNPGDGSLFGKKIVIDAGHGDHDSGALAADGSKEKDFTLKWALETERALEAKGANVVMVRSDDTFYTLQQRAAKAGNTGSDLFVSIHVNSYVNPNAYGTETYYDTSGNPYGTKSKKLAASVHNKIQPAIGSYNRGIRDYGYYVLRNNAKPAILIETAFLSNQSDLAKLKDTNTRQQFAKGVADGISDYFRAGN